MTMSNTETTPGTVKITKRAKKVRSPMVVAATGADILMRPTHEAPAAAERFEKFICWTLREGITVLTRPQLTIAAVLTMEGVVCEQDLLACLVARPSAVRRGDAVHVSWSINDVISRRSLSSLTVLALGGIDAQEKAQVDWTLELKKFSDTLRHFYPGANKLRKSELLKEAFFDASAWLYLNCPMACFAYISGQLRLSLLSDFAHDRKLGRCVKQAPDDKATLNSGPLAEAKDVALEKAFDDNRAASQSRWIIEALKKLVSVTAGQDGICSADYLARDTLRQRLGSVTGTLARAGTPTDALLLAWVLYLLETGSVRLKNPKIGTITRYVHAAVERLHGALNRGAIAPADRSQDDWEILFKDLLADDDVSKELRCALATFHCFLVSEFGLDPLPWLFVGVDEVSAVNASVVWPHEIRRAFDLISTCGFDERLRQTMQVMFAIGADSKVRIGDVRSLRLRNIRLDGDDLWIEIAPRRSHHQGKSSAARRILKFSNAEHRALISAWVSRREEESAEPDDLLFGDPHQPDKCYRIGTCQRLLNQVLRSATGEPDVSFHSLRHTVISRELLQALMTADVHHSISPIHQTAVEAGHRHDSTTFINYFHQPEEPVRHWIDKAVALHLDSPVVVAKWLGKCADTLRQGRQRAEHKSDFLPKQIRMHALSLFAEPVNVADETQQVVIPAPAVTGDIAMSNLMRLMIDLKGACSISGICSRSSTSEEVVVRISRAVAFVVGQLESRSRRYQKSLSQKANGQACLDFARACLRRLDFCFDLRAEPHLSGLMQQLHAATTWTAELAQAATAWTQVLAGGVLSLMNADLIKPLIELMQQASIGPDHLVVRVQLNDLNDPERTRKVLDSVEVTAARALIEASYQASVQIECVKSRRGRPDAYLVLSRRRTGTGRPVASAGCRMNRFNGWMLVLAVWNQYLLIHVKEVGNGDD